MNSDDPSNRVLARKIKIVDFNELESLYLVNWKNLFVRCFPAARDATRLNAVIQKYELNRERVLFALMIKDGKIEASYGGIFLDYNRATVFLSLDSMSSGVVPRSTTALARALYPRIKERGGLAVVGFPNRNIEALRRKYLGWEMEGRLEAYIAPPGMGQLFLREAQESAAPTGPWRLARPKRGFWSGSRRMLRLISRQGLSDGIVIAPIFTLSSARPGPFFIKIPTLLGLTRRFGFHVLLDGDAGEEVRKQIRDTIPHLNVESIDVP